MDYTSKCAELEIVHADCDQLRLELAVQAGSIEAMQTANLRLAVKVAFLSKTGESFHAENVELRAEVDRLTEQCRLFDAAAYKAKIEAQTLMEDMQAQLTTLESQGPIAWMLASAMDDFRSGNIVEVSRSKEELDDTPLYLAAGAALNIQNYLEKDISQAPPKAAAQPERAPLSNDEIQTIYVTTYRKGLHGRNFERAFARAIEAAIKQGGQHDKQLLEKFDQLPTTPKRPINCGTGHCSCV